MSATNLQNFSGDVQIRGTTLIKANTATDNLAIGTEAGLTAQGDNTVAVGNQAGKTSQGQYSTALGVLAGETSQGENAVAVGREAGKTSQGAATVAVGSSAGLTSQGESAIAVGNQAGKTSQGVNATAMGLLAGNSEQGAQGTAVGYLAGATKQGADTTAVGRQAGQVSQGASATAVGVYAGMTVQGAQAIAIGRFAGRTSQGASAVAVGYLAGQTSQAALSVGVGYGAGFTEQGGSAVAMGRNAGRTSQGAQGVAVGGYAGFSEQATFAVAVGYETGKTSQAGSATAMGYLAGNSEQGANAVAVGRAAGETSQGAQSVAMGYNAGESEQGTNAVAVGYLAGQTSQGANTTAVGVGAGNSEQGSYSVAVGLNAANVKQGGSAVAIGRDAGKTSQANNSVAVGYFAGYSEQSGQAVAIGIYAGSNKQGAQGVAVGIRAGQVSQGVNTTAVGHLAGQTEQGASATAVGTSAGTTSQGNSAVAVGNNSGNSEQGAIAVAVGASAGETSQGTQAIAMGYRAGEKEQGQFAVAVGTSSGLQAQGSQAVAVGYLAGKASQGVQAIAIGRQAGDTSQGAAAIAVGHQAGKTGQGANSIILNASGAAFDQTTASTFNVKPVRGGNIAASALAYTSGFEIVEETNMHFDTSGNVGIGTAAPGSLLHVNGDVRMKTLSTTVIGKVTAVYARGTGQNNDANRLVKIGDVTVVDSSTRGLTLTIINASTHAHVSSTNYDTHGSGTASNSLATALEAMTDAQIGILTSADAYEDNMTANLIAAAFKLGLTRLAGSADDLNRHPYSAIFYGPGAAANPGNQVLEVMKSDAASAAYATLSTFLVDDSFIGQAVTNALYSGTADSTTPTVFVDRYAKVGIGTTDPKVALHVRNTDGRLAIADASEDDCDTNAFNAGFFFVDNTWTGSVAYSGNPANGMAFAIAHISSSSKEISMRNMCGPLSIGSRDAVRSIYIDNAGKVGINETSPQTTLDISGDFQSYSGRHVKTVPIRHHAYNDVAGNGGFIRVGQVVPGQGAGYSGSFCAFDWFGGNSITHGTGDRWVTPNRIRCCWRWGFVQGYVANVTFKLWETLYSTGDSLKATIASGNGSISRGFTTVWGPPMTMIRNDVPGLKIEADSNTSGNASAPIRISDIWFEYVYV